MSFYRSILATIAAAVIVSPVFAEDNASAKVPADDAAPIAAQVSDNSSVSTDKTAQTDQQNVQAEENKININKATEKELIKVKGLNASKAKAIVKYRNKHGDFKSIDELAKVRGFTKMKADDLKNIENQLSI